MKATIYVISLALLQLKMLTTTIHALGIFTIILIPTLAVNQVIKINPSSATLIVRSALKISNGQKVLITKTRLLTHMVIKEVLNRRRHSVQLVLTETLKPISYKLEMMFLRKSLVFNG